MECHAPLGRSANLACVAQHPAKIEPARSSGSDWSAVDRADQLGELPASRLPIVESVVEKLSRFHFRALDQNGC
jgi:hypothetical protein